MTAPARPAVPNVPETAAAWIREYVLAPLQIPPAWPECPCQGVSNACEYGRHDECGHEQWIAWGGYEHETVISQGFAGFPCRGAFGLYGNADVYLADRRCRTRCNCPCHQPPPEPSTAPSHTEQLDLFPEEQ
ncbi:hypothetical protein [Streptomyces sp. NPDC052535]|uniref:hypothetical protein n=1 Tax=Streptomyces sp. NPDC052535 TaxID=3155531 RepID=UPI00341E81A6